MLCNNFVNSIEMTLRCSYFRSMVPGKTICSFFIPFGVGHDCVCCVYDAPYKYHVWENERLKMYFRG